jgi:hypothetical protein
MSTVVVTRTTCDLCGQEACEGGANGNTPPVGWAHITLYVRAPGSGWSGGAEREERTACPRCVGRFRRWAKVTQ